jgi:hypothetical protein
MRLFGISDTCDKGCELLFGVFTVFAFFVALNCALNDRWNKSELFVIVSSTSLAAFYFSRIFGWWKKGPK